MHFRVSLQQWSVGRRLRKGLPHNGRCPEIQGGNRQNGSWVFPIALGELLSPQKQSGVEQLAGTQTHSQTCGLCAPARARVRFLQLATSFPPPPSSPPPRRYLSLRGTRRAAEAATGTRSPRRVLGQSARSPRRRRARAEARAAPPAENRTGPSGAEPSRAGGAERGRRRRGAQVSWPEAGRAEGGTQPLLWGSGSRTRAGPADTAQRRVPRGPHVCRPAPRHVEGCAPFPWASGTRRFPGPGGRGGPGVPHPGWWPVAVRGPCDGLGHPWRLTGADPERAGASHPRRLRGTGRPRP